MRWHVVFATWVGAVDFHRTVHQSGQQFADFDLELRTAYDRLLANYDRRDGPEGLAEGLKAAPTTITVNDGRSRGHDFLVELSRADDPVDGVFQRARQAMTIFR
jgi:hypothetical protein